MVSMGYVPPHRLPRSLAASPLKQGDEILEINGVPIAGQDQKEVFFS